MKKITAFFMALLPIFVMVLLFVTGIIVKKVDPTVHANKVEITDSSVNLKKPKDDEEPSYQLRSNVLPKIANQDVEWRSGNNDIVQVDKKTGLVTGKSFGDAYIYCTSVDNPALEASCKIHVYDDKIHDFTIENSYECGYVGLMDKQQIILSTTPSIKDIIDPNFNFSIKKEDQKYLEVTQTGLLLPKEATNDKTVKVQITPHSDSTKVKELDVKVGPGVTQIGLNNPQEETITTKTYDFYKDIVYGPESNLLRTDFKYVSDDTAAATIDENGIATFKTPSNSAKYPTATFHATYKRKPELTTAKKITCTNSNFVEVYFSSPNITVTVGSSSKIIDNLKVYAYPDAENYSKITFASSNEQVVSITRDSNGKPIFNANKTGSAIVSATAYTGDKDVPTKTDVCCINVLPENEETFISSPSVTTNNYYYSLRNNLKIDPFNSKGSVVTWELDSETTEDIAELDDENGILHFKKAGNAKVIAKIPTLNDAVTFTVTCSPAETKAIPISESTTKVVVPVGQATTFTSQENWQPDFSGLENYFYFTTTPEGVVTFIPKSGVNVLSLPLKSTDKTKEINLIVNEDPIAIESSIDNVVDTTDTRYYFETESELKVIPSTAMSKEGERYQSQIKIDYQYSPSIASVEDNVIYFNAAGIVVANVKCADLNYIYVIRSSNGELGRFNVYEQDGTTLVEPFANITLSPSGTYTLKTNSLDYELAQNIEITSLNGVSTATRTLPAEGAEGPVTFTIKPNQGDQYYGKDIIKIFTNTFSFYINLNIEPEIQHLNVFYKDQILDNSSNIKTHTKNLVLYIDQYPISTYGKKTFTAKLNDTEDLTITNNSIDLSKSTSWKDGQINNLTLTAGTKTFEYKFEHLTTAPTFVLKDSTKQATFEDALYLSSNSTTKLAYVVTDGLVEDSYYNFTTKLETEDSEVKIQNGILCLSNVPMPSEDKPIYTNKLTLTPSVGESKTYDIGRDLVSKIVLPKHDNSDYSDLKGLQKVHVYGDHSFYKEDMAEVDYYKLPIEVYDFKGRLIEDTEEYPTLKEEALKEINWTSKLGTTLTVHPKDEKNKTAFMEVRFSPSCKYSIAEIADNKFAETVNKNETVGFSNRSKESIATYTFVVADKGINVYCQEALRAISDEKLSSRRAVLQTNFGMKDTTIDNEPLNDKNIVRIPTIFGNGYLLNYDEITTQRKVDDKNVWIDACNLLNVTYQGNEHANMSYDFKSYISFNGSDLDPNMGAIFEYCTFKGFTNGMNTPGMDEKKTLKKCLFYDNLISCIFGDKPTQGVYVEDCIFFDSGAYPCMIGQGCQIYFKGFIDVYNFHSDDMLNHLFDMDFRFLWPLLRKVAANANMIQKGADGKDYINSFMCSYLDYDIYFWNKNTGKYEAGLRGLPGAGEYLDKYMDLDLKAAGLNAQLWGTHDPKHQAGAPSYYDEFDKDGRQRLDFLSNQIKKIMRPIA